ncbi:nitrous oxide reductase accessory protein NosL [Marixanthomonas ophiurae]|uniref:Uncharacterized protein n=1 Tax=Marixanthomonas ophiurae TaxID=387659 RepID=A0A3E1QEJ1_9FLAO|nr:nitrous oxide reductase accessory protein NosL [Marixanthomonas ophiurae]RFN60525.1 hypothetical protein DZ858_09515 [Marixanthomonas ophiurae]
MKLTLSIFFLVLLFTACEVKPQKINYGSDNCQYCNMTIVDRQHASQIVTEKGRSYKFDAIECMINYHTEHSDQSVAMYLVNDFNTPGKLIDATTATYLISPEISSPMGANLSAFNSKQVAQKTQAEYSGKLYDWEVLRLYLKEKY